MDLPLLKPYFHGTTSRTGAPFWLGSWVFRTNVTADFGIVTGNFGPS
jgi:hypothetical protein